MFVSHGRTLLTTWNTSLCWVTDVKSKTSKIDVAMTPDEKSTETRLGKNIEDGIGNDFTINRHGATAICKTPDTTEVRTMLQLFQSSSWTGTA